MSIKVMSAVMDSYRGPAPRKLVLLVLADYANDEGISWPSLSSLGHKTNLARRQVIRHIHQLHVEGWLSAEQRTAVNNRQITNLYHIIIPVQGRVSSTTPPQGGRVSSTTRGGVFYDTPEGVFYDTQTINKEPSYEPPSAGRARANPTDLPPCFQKEHDSKTYAQLWFSAVEGRYGFSWLSKPTNRWGVAAAIIEGCPEGCDGSPADECLNRFGEILEAKENPGFLKYALANDPRPWAERGGGDG